MARQRFIWPTLWDDPDLGHVSPLAQLLYIGCFSLADDEGRIHGGPEFLKGAIFRYRKLGVDTVQRLRDELEAACSQFKVYDVNGNTYIAFANWGEFQKPKYAKPSKLPPPPKGKKRRQPKSQSQKLSGNPSPKLPETFREASPIGLGRDGLGLRTTAGSRQKGVAGPIEGLPVNIAYEVMNILKLTNGKDEGSVYVLAELARRATPALLADLRSRCRGHHIGWVVAALKKELAA